MDRLEAYQPFFFNTSLQNKKNLPAVVQEGSAKSTG
jgi:hypothetical protein